MAVASAAPDQTTPTRSGRRSRAKPKPPRPRVVVVAELRGLGGLVLEQALVDGEAEPLASLVSWADRLARELQVDGVGRPASYRDLMQAVVEVNRRAEAEPRPTIALPPAA